MRIHSIVASSVMLLLAIVIFSFSSDLGYLPVYSKTIELKHYDSNAKDEKISSVYSFDQKYKFKSQSVEIHGTFMLDAPNANHPYLNLFQTDIKDDGLRYEFARVSDKAFSSGIVIRDKKSPGGFLSFSIGNPPILLLPNKKYHIDIEIGVEGQLSYQLSGVSLNEPGRAGRLENTFDHYRVKHITIGTGFDKTRQFIGKIDDFKIKFKGYLPLLPGAWLTGLMILLLIVSFGITIIRNNKLREDSLKQIFSCFIAVMMIFSYPLLQMYSLNIQTVAVWVVVKYALLLSILALFLFVLFYLVYRNIVKAFLFIVVCSVYLFFSGLLYEALSYLVKPDLFVFICLLSLLGWHIAIQIIDLPRGMLLYCKRVVYLLFLMAMLSILFHAINSALSSSENNTKKLSAVKGNGYKPDIYFILSDMHAGRSSIKKHLGYDNNQFISKLQSLGFYVPNNAASNYAYTVLSIPSMLNLSYIPPSIDSFDKSVKYYSNNQMAVDLKKRGYHYIFISPRRYIIEKSDIADSNISCSKISDFEGMLWKYSLFFRNNKIGETYRNDVLCGLGEIKKSVFSPGPKFVFAHILSPHPPYVFDKNGGTVPLEQQSDVRKSSEMAVLNKKSYLAQLNFIEDRLTDIVGFILKNSKRPPIIIVQGDHGFSLYSAPELSSGRKIPSSDYVNARMRVLSAYYFPQGGRSVLYDTISPINMTRGLMRYYFNRDDLKRLPDISYWSAETNLWQYTAVTDVIRQDDLMYSE